MIKPAKDFARSTTREAYERELFEIAKERLQRGLAPPPEIYRVRDRGLIDWSIFPDWARPLDPEVFDGCCHEG